MCNRGSRAPCTMVSDSHDSSQFWVVWQKWMKIWQLLHLQIQMKLYRRMMNMMKMTMMVIKVVMMMIVQWWQLHCCLQMCKVRKFDGVSFKFFYSLILSKRYAAIVGNTCNFSFLWVEDIFGFLSLLNRDKLAISCY